MSSQLSRCCLSCIRHVSSLTFPPVILSSRALSSSSATDLPHYRDRADQLNNPYRDLYRKPHGKRAVTFRDRFIEAKKNEPKPRIGKGDKADDMLSLEGGKVERKRSFYKDGSRLRFGDLGVMSELGSQIAELGVVYPTHHQCDVIPVLMQGSNCVFISPTGSGKTYTYLLPIVQNVLNSKQEGYITKSGAPRIIIMAPTKFLSLQIGLVVDHLIQDLQLRSVCLTQLTSSAQSREIQGHPIDILVGTYDNITSWIASGHVTTRDLQHLVIDELDEFLDYRKVAENSAFLREFCDEEDGSSRCQIILAGAFLHQAGFKKLTEIVPDIEKYLNSKSHVPLPHVKQNFCFVNNRNKADHLVELLQQHQRSPNYETQRPLIFCNFSNTSYWLHKHLIQHNINNIHVGKQSTSKAKTRLIRQEIPNTTYPIVTTDSFAYGLDLREVGLVINYEFPFTYEDYIRRVGRTGRMSSNSNNCQAVSYVSYKRDKALYNIIKNSTAQNDCLSTVLLSTNKYGWLRK